jgi:hypothetical protein
MRRLVPYSAFAVLAGLACGCARTVPAAVAGRTPFSLSIALPAKCSEGHPRLLYLTRGTHFHVVLENRSTEEVLLWTDDCSAGYDALAFELRDSGGRVWTATKLRTVWTANVPDCWRVRPGEKLVFNVYPGLTRLDWPDSVVTDPLESYLALFDPRDMQGWQGFPIAPPEAARGAQNFTQKLWMRAVYRSTQDAFAEAVRKAAQPGDQASLGEVWCGVVRSEWYEVELANVGLERLAE